MLCPGHRSGGWTRRISRAHWNRDKGERVDGVWCILDQQFSKGARMKRKELTVEKLDAILIEWLMLASTDLGLPTWTLHEGHEGYILPLLCLTIGIRLLLFPSFALALAAF